MNKEPHIDTSQIVNARSLTVTFSLSPRVSPYVYDAGGGVRVYVELQQTHTQQQEERQAN